MEFHRNKLEEAYDSGSELLLYELITQKCALMNLVFDLDIYQSDRAYIESLKVFFKEYLFCMQLVDDHADLEEDYFSSDNNHNLFLKGLSHEQSVFLIRNKGFYFLPLVHLIKNKILSLSQIYPDAHLLNEKINETLDYLDKIANNNSHLPNSFRFNEKLSDWNTLDNFNLINEYYID